MTNKKPTRASQSKSDSTKVQSQAASVKPKTVNKPWTPPSYLDTPNAPNGYRHRWVRIETLGIADTKNIQGRLRSGYELVRDAGVIGHGGLVLTRVPEEIAQQRQAYFEKQAQEQVEAVDNDLMKEQDRRMPIDIDKQSRTFGGKR